MEDRQYQPRLTNFSYSISCKIDIDDFLEEEIRGPANFVCKDDKSCVFEGMGPCHEWDMMSYDYTA